MHDIEGASCKQQIPQAGDTREQSNVLILKIEVIGLFLGLRRKGNFFFFCSEWKGSNLDGAKVNKGAN
jgi:hypothetical protein